MGFAVVFLTSYTGLNPLSFLHIVEWFCRALVSYISFRRVSSWGQLACTQTWKRKSPNCPPQRRDGGGDGEENSAPQKGVSIWVVFGFLLLHLIVFPVKILYLTKFILGCSVGAGDGSGGRARKPLRRLPERFEGCTSSLRLCAEIVFTNH